MNPFTCLLAIIGVIALATTVRFWIRHHYRARERFDDRSAEREGTAVTDLAALAGRLDKRLQTLETILDRDVPDWRKHHDLGS